MDFKIISSSEWPFKLPANDLNYVNYAFCNHKTLQSLQIQIFGYRLLKNAHLSHITLIMHSQHIHSDNLLAITQELKVLLNLNQADRIQVERIPLGIHGQNQSLMGLPLFDIAKNIELVVIENEVADYCSLSLLTKLKPNSFYFRLGMEFSIALKEIDRKCLKTEKQQTRRVLTKLIHSNGNYRFKFTIRSIETKNNQRIEDQLQNQNKYYLYDSTSTTFTLETNSKIHKFSITKYDVQRSYLHFFELGCYTSVKQLIWRLMKSQDSYCYLHSKKACALSTFLRIVSQQLQLNYHQFNCQKQYSLNVIKQYVLNSCLKSPILVYVKNIEWILELTSGNVEPAKTSFKFLQALQEEIGHQLNKKLNSFKVLIIFGYNKDLFNIKQLSSKHVKFQIRQYQSTLKSTLLQYGLHQETIQQLLTASKIVGWKTTLKLAKKQLPEIQLKKQIQNLIKKEKVASIPQVRWDDIGGLDVAKQEIIQTILLPKEHPQIFDSLIRPRTGLLFYGPPGTGKTLLAKCIANQCKMNFISVKGPEMLNMYIGQSQKNIRQTFQKAIQNKPCIIFFDQLDALVPKRGMSSDSNQVMDRIVAELMTQMDIISQSGDVFVIGATNRPDLLDPSIMRPGRFDKQIYLGMCNRPEDRINILKAQTKKLPLDQDINFEQIDTLLPQNLTGADFYGLTSKAVLIAINEKIQILEKTYDPVKTTWQQHISQSKVAISQRHMIEASKSAKPSVTPSELQKFEQLKSKYS